MEAKIQFLWANTLAKNMRHLLIILEHCDFAYFFWKLPSKEQFRILCVKKEIAYHYSRMKSGKNINSSLWKRLSSFYFQSDQQVSKAFYKALKRWEEQRSSSSLFNVERSLSPFLAESLECLTLIAFKIDAKKVELAPLQREIEPLQNWSLKKSKKKRHENSYPHKVGSSEKFA